MWSYISIFCLTALALEGCDSVQPTPVQHTESTSDRAAFINNATDAVGVAEGEQKVSPFGKPAH